MELIYPSEAYIEEFKKAKEEYIEHNVTYYKGFFADTDGLVERCENERLGINLAEGRVPQTTYWLIDKGHFIGMICLRHYLNDVLLFHGGHIGYGIRVPYQKQGYGTKMLALVLDKAREMGMKRVLVTCLDENYGSAKVIENNGGVLENKVLLESENNIYRRYWIEL